MSESAVIIVTGAGSGIGRAVSVRLAGSGARLSLIGRNQTRLDETARLIGVRHARAAAPSIFAGDVAEQGQCIEAVDATIKRWGRVDALINNAGMVMTRPIDVVDRESLGDIFSANAFGPAYLIAACWPHFVRQRGGRIVNVSSMATIDPFPGLAMYAASKAALESLTRSIMVEGGPHNILGFTIALGAVETPMLRLVVSTSELPASQTLDPDDAAKVIAACAAGERDVDAGDPLIIRK